MKILNKIRQAWETFHLECRNNSAQRDSQIALKISRIQKEQHVEQNIFDYKREDTLYGSIGYYDWSI